MAIENIAEHHMADKIANCVFKPGRAYLANRGQNRWAFSPRILILALSESPFRSIRTGTASGQEVPL